MEISIDPTPDPRPPNPELEHHPAAALFPLMEVESAEFGELVQDIREQGLLRPIVLRDGKILDGRNRYRACQHAGVEPHFVEWRGESPTAFVLSLNLHRRHLTEDQKAAVVQAARARLEAEAKERQRAAGRQFGRGHAGKLLADSPEAIEPDGAPAKFGRDPVPTTRQRLAELADVSEHKIRQAERVMKADPDLAEQVRSGALPLREAERLVERRETDTALADAVERYPFLRDVPGHPPARLLDIADTLDAADGSKRAAMEDQARRWCDAQRELMPQWKAENEDTRLVDGIVDRLSKVNGILSQHGAARVAELLVSRLVPDNDIAIVRSALAHLSELDRELAGRERIRRVK